MSTIIRVTGEHPSTITVGHGLGFEPIREALDEAATKALIIHARPLARRAEALAQYLREQGIEAATVDHPDAEAGKSIEVVSSLGVKTRSSPWAVGQPPTWPVSLQQHG